MKNSPEPGWHLLELTRISYLQSRPLIMLRFWSSSRFLIVSTNVPASMPVSRKPEPRGRLSLCAKAAIFHEAKQTIESETTFLKKSSATSFGSVEQRAKTESSPPS